ncbi:MAG: hypothetical protein VB108_03845 [Anaerolineaceae bacterium]|nr:hypothetical protein [Anaerolineaceae bacterium]
MSELKIHIAFRFHVNFYHSYRGDTADELGFGKDIRIIRNTLRVLDNLNTHEIPVRGTWDFENFFSLETIMPQHCPDIVQTIQGRVQSGMDEVEFMSYNNGFMNAHTPLEFERAMGLARSNPQGSGLQDLFGTQVAEIVRPQEMMYSPIHLRLYQQAGIKAISLYYSAVPFNAFSNFIPLLGFKERYNPLRLAYPGLEESMTLLPAYNVGDLVEHLSLRCWVKRMRKEQLKSKDPADMLLILDQDADDAFWFGFGMPNWIRKVYPDLFGLEGLAESIKDLDFIEFSTPCRYLETHKPLREISFGQDAADGSFDGMTSWVEKWSNHQVFTGLERSRIMDLQAFALAGYNPALLGGTLRKTLDQRVKLLSTTHFGMAAPLMNLTREKKAAKMLQDLIADSQKNLQTVLPPAIKAGFELRDYIRGFSNQSVAFDGKDSSQLIQVEVKDPQQMKGMALWNKEDPLDYAFIQRDGRNLLVFKENFKALEQKTYRIAPASASKEKVSSDLFSGVDGLGNGLLKLSLDGKGFITRLTGPAFNQNTIESSASYIQYGAKRFQVDAWESIIPSIEGPLARLQMQGSFSLPGGYHVRISREFMLLAGLPYLYIWQKLVLPRTPDQKYNTSKARRLQQAWDASWEEMAPFEITPSFAHLAGLKIWKQDYCGFLTHYSPDYSGFTPNKTLANINNHITAAWVAISDGRQGLLLAQNADYISNVAFCPMRSVMGKNGPILRLNPFGSYSGSQYRYSLAETGLGRFLATRIAPAGQLAAMAPSYNGRTLSLMLMLAPYQGDAPSEKLRNDALAFAYPAFFNGDSDLFAQPPHHTWSNPGLGLNPDGLGPRLDF